MADSATQTAEAVQSSPNTNQPQSPNTINKSTDANVESDPIAKFRGSGTSFRAKIIGIDDVPEPRGDKMCQDSIIKLKENVKVSGQHKQKLVINISLGGIKLIDLMTAQVLHQHPVDKISFIARDMSDRRAFGYIYGDEEGQHHFFALKTAKVAEQVVLDLRDLFQAVYSMKNKDSGDKDTKTENQNQPQQSPANPPLTEAAKTDQNILGLADQFSNMDGLNSASAVSPTTKDSDMFGMEECQCCMQLSLSFCGCRNGIPKAKNKANWILDD